MSVSFSSMQKHPLLNSYKYLKYCLNYFLLGILIFLSPGIFAKETQPALLKQTQQTQLTQIKINTSLQETTLRLMLDNTTDYKIFRLSSPARLVVDLDHTHYAADMSPVDFSKTDIINFHHGIQHKNNLRLVFYFKTPPYFDIKTEHHEKLFEIKLYLSGGLSPAAKDQSPKNIPKTFIVVIDPGHGGKDPGATGPEGIHEKNVTLAIARDLAALVDAQPGMKAILTRTGDYYVGLRNRLKIARKAKGDIFIAIHADAFNDTSADGASVFALSLHGSSSEAALWLAQKENYSELGGIDLDHIAGKNDPQIRSVLIDLSQTAAIHASLQLGGDVIEQLGKITQLHHNTVEQAPFMVLKSPDIPSILVETGFITNPEEESRLKTQAYQEKLAKALMAGIESYYAQNQPKNLSGGDQSKIAV